HRGLLAPSQLSLARLETARTNPNQMVACTIGCEWSRRRGDGENRTNEPKAAKMVGGPCEGRSRIATNEPKAAITAADPCANQVPNRDKRTHRSPPDATRNRPRGKSTKRTQTPISLRNGFHSNWLRR